MLSDPSGDEVERGLVARIIERFVVQAFEEPEGLIGHSGSFMYVPAVCRIHDPVRRAVSWLPAAIRPG